MNFCRHCRQNNAGTSGFCSEECRSDYHDVISAPAAVETGHTMLCNEICTGDDERECYCHVGASIAGW